MAWRCSSTSNVGLVTNLHNASIIKSQSVLEAMKATDRANYVLRKGEAYQDSPQSIGYNSTISAPHMHAFALEYLAERLAISVPSTAPSLSVLDVGSGSGVCIALFYHLCRAQYPSTDISIIGIDHMKDLVSLSEYNLRADGLGEMLSNGVIEVIYGDGRKGYLPNAPYDLIHVGAASPSLPSTQTLISQLKPGGRMFVPICADGGGKEQNIWVIDKDHEGKVEMENVMGVRYIGLIDEQEQWP